MNLKAAIVASALAASVIAMPFNASHPAAFYELVNLKPPVATTIKPTAATEGRRDLTVFLFIALLTLFVLANLYQMYRHGYFTRAKKQSNKNAAIIVQQKLIAEGHDAI